jgi:hypothetical protein
VDTAKQLTSKPLTTATPMFAQYDLDFYIMTGKTTT